MPNTLQLIGRQIRKLRERRGLSQEALAELAGVSRAYFGRVERGDADLSVTVLHKIAAALGVPATDLLSGDGVQ